MKPHGRAQCVGAARNRRQRDATTPRPEDDRRNHDVQAIEASGRDEARHRM